jgi:hypothetical protein
MVSINLLPTLIVSRSIFLHIKPQDTKGKKVLPLLLVHGWPGIWNFAIISSKLPTNNTEYVFLGSFVEFIKII